MRSRSHRMTSSDPKDDWVDGSWTVDCVCGVNYDDGEEMVDCDECGVWVHTRCSNYVKSEKSFACDKCKIRNCRNDSEETEVAQLLIELPTKTMRMESSYNQRLSSDQPPPRRPFKLWTEKPMEDRVHIQGIPGGDPALFAGKSSIFSPALWKASGYVPKKFNFQYRKFPCWDMNEDASPSVEQEIDNPVDKDANVLFSFSKENTSNTLVGMEERGERGNDEREPGSKEGKKYKGENLDIRHSPKATTKSRRSFAIHSSKKKEDFKTSKKRNGKKRARDHEESANIKNKVAVKPTSDAKEFEFHDDKVSKFNKNDSQSILASDSGHTMFHQTLPVKNGLAETNLENCKNNIVDHSSQAFNCDISRHDCTEGAVQKEQQDGRQIFGSAETSSKSNCAAPRVGSDYAGSVLLRGARMGADKLNSNGEHLSTNSVLESLKQDSAVALPKLEGIRIVENSNGSILHTPEQPEVQVETEGGHSDSIADMKQPFPLSNEKSCCFDYSVQYTRISSNHMEESFKVDDSTVLILKSSDDKAQDVEGSSETVGGSYTDKMKESSDDHYQPNEDVKTIDGCNALSKSYSKPKDDSSEAEGQLKSGEIIPRAHSPVSSQRKMVVCEGKSSSMPSTNFTSKSSICDDARKVNSRTSDPITIQRISGGGIIKKDDVASDAVNEENEMPRKYPKELSKSSVGSTLKTLHSSKSLQSTVSKHMVSESKEPVVYTSARASLRQNAAVMISSGEAVEPSQTQNASFGWNKITSSGSLQKCDKLIQSSCQSSSKVTLTRAANPPAPSSSPATLSDEELALLLHQELNSSSRVPRVPRVHQVGSLPQLGSPTATSMLKRTSSFGGKDHKDHSSMSTKKVKDVKDGSRGVHERVPSSPSRRRQTSGDVADASTRKKVVNGSPEAINLVKKNIRCTSSETTNSVSSSSEATGQNSSSIRNLRSNISDDVTSLGRSSVHCTLPGLINEIMSKGKRMTYEELCDAVLPHWNNLRKHNGERYAYASHFQAVLDCLRNRTEWAQLVDRGPKTNAGRKKPKVDPEQQLSFESEDKHSKGRTEVESKNLELYREDVPKGKRKARKRRLALQGRGIKDVRKKRKVDVVSDNDETSQSFKSREECLFSDDEFQGGETCRAETEDSGSSDET